MMMMMMMIHSQEKDGREIWSLPSRAMEEERIWEEIWKGPGVLFRGILAHSFLQNGDVRHHRLPESSTLALSCSQPPLSPTFTRKIAICFVEYESKTNPRFCRLRLQVCCQNYVERTHEKRTLRRLWVKSGSRGSSRGKNNNKTKGMCLEETCEAGRWAWSQACCTRCMTLRKATSAAALSATLLAMTITHYCSSSNSSFFPK